MFQHYALSSNALTCALLVVVSSPLRMGSDAQMLRRMFLCKKTRVFPRASPSPLFFCHPGFLYSPFAQSPFGPLQFSAQDQE